jgi:hypothetical protein
VKFKFDRSVLVKLAIILVIFLIAPYAVPFSIEFVLMADILGLEALILFLFFQSKHLVAPLLARLHTWKNHLAATLLLLLGLYMMQPDILLAHALGSAFLLMLTCSVAFALAIWLPSFLLSLSSESRSYITIKSIRDAPGRAHY